MPNSVNYPPILFVHGNGDYSALWITTLWRFESAGYPRELLFIIDFPSPKARDDDTREQPGHSGTAEQREQLTARVREILAQTGASKLALVANSRGGNSVRNYIKNGEGANTVSHAVLCGTPNHGAIAVPLVELNFEFNGEGHFLKGLNDCPDGNEVPPGVSFMTIRSDKNDKFAQPRTLLSPIAVSYEGPALKGAHNVVLANLDHRETAYHPRAFAEIFQFITGQPPAATEISQENAPQLSGLVTGYEHGVPTNRGVSGVVVRVYEIDQSNGARLGDAVHQATTGADGAWGSFVARPTAYYEFEVAAPNQPVRHFFRSPFPRSSNVVMLRLFPDKAEQDEAIIMFNRPRGYIATGRDQHLLDGKPVPGIGAGVPSGATFRCEMAGPERPVAASLNGESLMVRAIPGEVVYAEFHY